MRSLALQELILVGIAAVVLVGWILGAIGAGFYAIRLRRTAAWAFVSLIVSPLPVFLLLFGLGPREDDDEERIACPFCAEEIKAEARLCPYCRSDLGRSFAERLRPR